MDEDLYLKLMAFSRKVAIALEKTVPCKRIGVAVVGLEVPHTHVHLIPLQDTDDMRFQRKTSLTSEEFSKLAKDIAEKLQVSAKTVATHRSRLMQKMGFSTNAELILYANKSGLLL